MNEYKNVLFPELMNKFLTNEEKETVANILRIRDFIEKFIEKRRVLMQDPTYVSKHDLLDILLTDGFFL
jgi:hypothetical protein